MPGRVYATPEQYQARTGQAPPGNIDTLLAYASQDVDAALLDAVYATDSAGIPTDPALVGVLADATCDQVAYIVESGGDTTGAAGQWDSVSIGPVSLGGRRGGAPSADGTVLGPRAAQTLALAGVWRTVWPEVC